MYLQNIYSGALYRVTTAQNVNKYLVVILKPLRINLFVAKVNSATITLPSNTLIECRCQASCVVWILAVRVCQLNYWQLTNGHVDLAINQHGNLLHVMI